MKSLARLQGLSSVLDRSPDFVEVDGTPLRVGVVDLAQGKSRRKFKKMRKVQLMRLEEPGGASEVGAHRNRLRTAAAMADGHGIMWAALRRFG